MNQLDIKNLRKKNNITQQQLADYLGVSLRTVANWEGGSVIPKSKHALIARVFKEKAGERIISVRKAYGTQVELAKALGISVDELIRYEDGEALPEHLDKKIITFNNVLNLSKTIFLDKFSKVTDYGRYYKISVKRVESRSYDKYKIKLEEDSYIESLGSLSFIIETLDNTLRYLCFQSSDDSMNRGQITDTPSGSDLLCQEVNKDTFDITGNESEYGYVIVHKDTIVHRDIQYKNKNEIICKSRSGLPQHSDFTIKIKDIKQIWRVIKRAF